MSYQILYDNSDPTSESKRIIKAVSKGLETQGSNVALTIEDSEMPVGIIDRYVVNASGELVSKSRSDLTKMDNEKAFSALEFFKFVEASSVISDDTRDDLRGYQRSIENYVSARDFGSVKRLGERLVARSIISSTDFAAIKFGFARQNINLDNY